MDYSIWVLEYAVITEFAQSSSVYGAHNRGTRPLPFGYAVIKGGGNVVMVDIGMGDGPMQRQIGDVQHVSGWQPPDTVLAEIGLAPSDVTHAIITHAHYDHFGNPEAFPNAVFYIEKREVDFWLGQLARPHRLQTFIDPIDPGNLTAAYDLAAQGRLRLLDGRAVILDGIEVRPAYDTHTPGSCYVVVDSGHAGRYVFAGDLLYSWESLEGLDGDGIIRPPGLVLGSHLVTIDVLEEMLRTVDGEPRRVIPVHENRLPEQYPSRLSGAGAAV
ncbi:MAG: N-acyl homoserine lactonase family protein, partial [Propionicimonas sp.]|nr:N-acyl homoserine lactonase family protein [Propionicimonas sp.]